ncbi:MAG: hypothetical protein HOO96_00740, partial [Polyangiaceae bacterium]|nr:hypothetical protein [Polyangiaceae bacterium]
MTRVSPSRRSSIFLPATLLALALVAGATVALWFHMAPRFSVDGHPVPGSRKDVAGWLTALAALRAE